MYLQKFFLLLSIVCLASCKSSKIVNVPTTYCEPPTYTNIPEIAIHFNTDSLLASSPLRAKFSEQGVLLAYATGVADDLEEFLAIGNDTTLVAKHKKTNLALHIDTRMMYILSEINSVSAELDCEGERLDQIANAIDNINDKRNNNLTVTSIVVGAAATIAGAYITNDNWNQNVTVGGGILGAGLSFLTLNPKGAKIQIDHPHNLLRSFWKKENNNDFPAFVWYMLNEPRFSNSGKNSLLHNACNRWLQYYFDNKEKEANSSILFTDGGIYRAGEIHQRATMINQLQSIIRSLNQNLNFFIIEINSLTKYY
ncbi:MAG: hypothetical protein Q3983_04605 [Capnocytophaga sp.]|nr:hypothetical protein [Capnocytophaga sp.]